ncbi:MAG: pro-sigmaK processing inhibitor BofA family protein [Clostridia bacterium]|nr:pro-sigmaK processing inhibitor BofA family protein [Clostridia bacterium]
MTELYIFVGFLIFIALVIFKISKSFFKALFTSVLGGLGAICAVGAISYFIPISIGMNWLTLLISSLFSVPGVILVLLMNIFCV